VNFITPEIVFTGDGSHSLYLAEIDEHYHSHHGALQESLHVYINAGLKAALKPGVKSIRVFELGFGTGLNALLTADFAEREQIDITFHSIEKYPVNPEALLNLNYETGGKIGVSKGTFDKIISAEWGKEVKIGQHFTVKKIWDDFFDYKGPESYFDVFYFDAFGHGAQSEMWGENIFGKCFDLLKPGGILVTYAAKGSARRAMESCGFNVERIEGAPGKREMMRATKPA
jgi:tRNA U34 5-methylaminomethyl-2-thiouridine-forming methyltransferase MnmC